MNAIGTSVRTRRRVGGFGPALLGVVLAIGLGACNKAATPSGTPLPDSAFQVEWLSAEVPAQMKPDEVATVKVKFRNISDEVWPDRQSADPAGTGAYSVRLAWRWRISEDMAAGEGTSNRADLTEPLGPGRETTLAIDVIAPHQPGEYTLQLDLVQELVAYFEDRGAKLQLSPVVVVQE